MPGEIGKSEVIFGLCRMLQNSGVDEKFCSPNWAARDMPLSSTFSAAADATELMRSWKVDKQIALLALSNVAERGIGSRGAGHWQPRTMPHSVGYEAPSHCDYLQR